MRKFVVLTAALTLLPSLGWSAGTVKIGFITTLSSPQLAAGPELLDGFKLGIDDSGGKLGGMAVDLVVGDDQGKPDIGVQLARKMMDEDKVQLITGIVPSNIMLAVAHAVLARKMFLVGLQAGPSQFAGAECNPNLFITSDQTDTASEAVGMAVNARGLKDAYLVAANYAAGRDVMTGFKRTFKGKIDGETYTPLGQLDYAAELTEVRNAHPAAVMYFQQSGNASINFVKQYAEAGLKGQVPLYGVATVLDEQTLPGMGDAALGVQSGGFWAENLDVPANKIFIEHFRAKYHRGPSVFSVFAYDGAHLIDSALSAVDGHIENADAFRAALQAAKFQSVRGKFRFNKNHYPIQSVYLLEVGRDAKGGLINSIRSTVAADYPDSYVGACKMP